MYEETRTWRWWNLCGWIYPYTWRSGRVRGIRLVIVVGLTCACVTGWAEGTMAAADRCPNEIFRVGPSASLPDCRAYELVTAENLASSQDTPFTGETEHAIPSADGEHLVQETYARLEPEPTVLGSLDVFSRTLTGWTVKSAVAPGTGAQLLELKLLSPELSQVALESYTKLNAEEQSPHTTFEVGPAGGPYTPVAEVPRLVSTELVGANAGTPSVPAFSDVLLASPDPAVLPAGSERTVAEKTLAGRFNLYEWSSGHLRLVAVDDEGKLLSLCGSTLASGSTGYGGKRNAISADGSKIFFATGGSGPNCEVPGGLYMRVAGSSEPVEVSAPQDVKLAPSERREVVYMGATPDGSEVFFATGEALTKDAPDDGQPNLYEYNIEAPAGARLTFIANGVETRFLPRWFVVSEDGSTVYYGFDDRYYRYDTRTKETSFVATPGESKGTEEAVYTTPNGAFFVFPASGVEGEPRDRGASEPNAWGTGHYGYNGLFRYNNADKSVACVSCGGGLLPAPNFENVPLTNVMIQPVGGFGQGGEAVLKTSEAIPAFVDMSDNGQQVFFQTTAQLVPQDTNSTVFEEATVGGASGLDVYEWEADGANGCTASLGCTYLLSGGGGTGASVFLGASKDGSNVFFASAAPLLPQATPEFTNIYDARVDGGFAPPMKEIECLSCQGVGSPPPLFSVPAGVSFVGAGNPIAPHPPTAPPSVAATRKRARCTEGRRLSHNRCVRAKSKHKVRAKRAGENRRGQS
jgi:hypothetical protein